MVGMTRVQKNEGRQQTEQVAFVADCGGGQDQIDAIRALGTTSALSFVFTGDEVELLRDIAVTAKEDLPSVIVLTGYLSHFEGVDPLMELQADPALWEIPVVVVLAEADHELEVSCYQRGASWVGALPAREGGGEAFADVIGDIASAAAVVGVA